MADDDPGIRELPASLWKALREDPSHAPEHLALIAGQYHGPAARDWVAKQHAAGRRDPHELAKRAKTLHARLARAGGAATGFGGFATVVPDLVFAAWVQSRCIFYVAAAFGKDPTDPLRSAEQLVIQRIYDDVQDASSALRLEGGSMAVAMAMRKVRGDSPKKGRNQTLVARLSLMIGTRAVSRFSSRLVPGLAVLTNAVGNEGLVREVADRAVRFYE